MKRILGILLLLALVAPAGAGFARQAEELPLSGPGMYPVGLQLMSLVDEARENRELAVAILYPAIEPEDTSAADTAALIGAPFAGFRDAEPDVDGGPYPLILYSPAMGDGVIDWVAPLNHLASHGFVVVSIEHGCADAPTCVIDRPLDVIFVLDEIAALAEGSLVGLADTNNVGLLGLETGGYTALAAGGARIDPEGFLDWSRNRDEGRPVSFDHFSGWFGWEPVTSWDEIAAYRDQFDDLQTDERIKAILPITPAFGMLFGEHGLENVNAATLIVTITANLAVSYEDEVVPVFDRLGMDERFLVTLVDYRWVQGGHVKWPHPQEQEYYNHFALAFFGMVLQGQDAYADYLTSEFLEGYDDLAWGVYEGQ